MLSVAVIAKDTAQTLPECLNSAKNLSDDIVVVVDAATIDATAQ
ncbi:MAG: Glycosyl transferase family 2, partial [Candidatus Amesbacteria bacterium GW2011_GWC1_48_10]